MMYKIVSVERSWWTSSWELPRPRQLFVTRSGELSRQVQRLVRQILESFRLADLTEQELADIWKNQAEPAEYSRPLPTKWSELEDDHFPLLISFNNVRHACVRTYNMRIDLVSNSCVSCSKRISQRPAC